MVCNPTTINELLDFCQERYRGTGLLRLRFSVIPEHGFEDDPDLTRGSTLRVEASIGDHHYSHALLWVRLVGPHGEAILDDSVKTACQRVGAYMAEQSLKIKAAPLLKAVK